ncbi:DNA-directed RNA polymerase II subunit RPB11 [Drechslerella dactyloides]|uniref:DNA-directed RNA polymerase II subunit RPB11 n=1 Tax=Drechslerella dactyloides TaxID=74499 RepID=A0AAD6J0K9_DREDA|nr:DNA-directed RNA polymerase II subunit RPB11 [Drechslerella dactyloides]
MGDGFTKPPSPLLLRTIPHITITSTTTPPTPCPQHNNPESKTGTKTWKMIQLVSPHIRIDHQICRAVLIHWLLRRPSLEINKIHARPFAVNLGETAVMASLRLLTWAILKVSNCLLCKMGRRRVPNCVVFTFIKEDHTLGNLLRAQLLKDPKVIFAGYKVPHPLFPNFELRVQTTDETNPRAALIKASQDLIKDLTIFRNNFTREWELKKMIEPQKEGI